ncbi:hypothetical protein KI688_006563 [Linnemannia hyalina]|uniref:Uncharacterized protein n=1 Tax=Linnemannia hyalina TaxID=64524 RepID=A0A9P8BNV9_9FUNG|nr:hypothetical protein KI688_006563 [Linnemannia hyalina]
MPPLYIGHVEEFASALFTTVHHHFDRPAKDNQQADHSVQVEQRVEADQQADHPVQVEHTVEANQQADHPFQVEHTVEAEQDDYTVAAEQQTLHPIEAEQVECTVEAEQQAAHIVDECDGKGLRLRFIDLHLQHMEFLETQMRSMIP